MDPASADHRAAARGDSQFRWGECLYRARWQRATPQQRQIMRAMSDLAADGPVAMAQVADAIGRERNELSVPRDQLIKKGLVYAPERGLIAFTVPGMADYVSRQPD